MFSEENFSALVAQAATAAQNYIENADKASKPQTIIQKSPNRKRQRCDSDEDDLSDSGRDDSDWVPSSSSSENSDSSDEDDDDNEISETEEPYDKHGNCISCSILRTQNDELQIFKTQNQNLLADYLRLKTENELLKQKIMDLESKYKVVY